MSKSGQSEEKRRAMLEECAMLEKFVKDATEAKSNAAVRPIIQRYANIPSFAYGNNQVTRMRFYPPPPPRALHSNSYHFPSRSHFMVRPTYRASSFGRHAGVPRVAHVSRGSSKSWVRPSLGASGVNLQPQMTSSVFTISKCTKSVSDRSSSSMVGPSTDSNVDVEPVITGANSTKVLGMSRESLVDVPVNAVQSTSGSASSLLLSLPRTNSKFISSTGPIKPIVPLNKRSIFRIGNSKSRNSRTNLPTRINRKSLNTSLNGKKNLTSKYKVDRRSLATKDKLGLDIARKTVVAGLNLSQRRSLTALAKKTASKHFLISQYSVKRIRKSSSQSLSYYKQKKNNASHPGQIKGALRWVNRKSISSHSQLKQIRLSQTSASISAHHKWSQQGSPLELCSLSMSQTPTIRLATRAVQLSRQRLSDSTRKVNKICSFYSRFGICKRMEDGKCRFFHDPKQRNVCSKFLKEGKCESQECKLSHDLKEGKIPTCTFFNKGSCIRENCQYLHILSTPTKKKLRQCKFGLRLGSPIKAGLKELSSIKNKTKVNVNCDTEKEVEKVDEKPRYFEISPDSQPIVSIIPRRYPKGLEQGDTCDSNSNQSETYSNSETKRSIQENVVTVLKSEEISSCGANTLDSELILSSDDDNIRRQRMLTKIVKLKEDFKGKSAAPTFLGFNQ